MSSEVTIEPAASDDIDAVTELWVRLARGQRDYDSAVRAEANRDAMRETLAAHQITDSLLVARLEETDTIVGFASFSLERGTLELDTTRGTLSNLYVDPAYRDRGIGTALLEAVEEAFADSDAEVLTLEVLADNEDARRFYRDHGFEQFRITMARSLADDDRSENDTHSKEDR